MITVHGRADSINVQKVLWLFDELGLAYERIDRGTGFGGTDTPEYRALNPNGKVPTIEDDGLIMWESQAILRHYARADPEAGLFPADPVAALRCDMALDWNHTMLWAAVRLPYLAVAAQGKSVEDAGVRDQIAAASAVVPALDWFLDRGAYLAGARFSIADIAVMASVHRLIYLGCDVAAWPKVAAWHARCAARPPYAKRVFARGQSPT